MHLDNVTRDAFHTWIEDDCPNLARPFPGDGNDHTKRMTAESFLRMFLGCADIIPGDVCNLIASVFRYERGQLSMTYAEAASALLARRVGGDEVGAKYLDALLWHPMVTFSVPSTMQQDGDR